MSITLGTSVAVGDNSSTQTLTVSYASLTSGRGLIAHVIWADFSGSETITSITVEGESNMTLLGTAARSGANWRTQMAYLPVMSAGGTKNITVTISGSNGPIKKMIVQEVYDDVSGEIVSDGVANGQANGTNPSVNVSSGTDNNAIFAVLMNDGAEPTTGAGFTSLHSGASYAYERVQYDLDVGTAGSIAAGWTAASADWSVAAAAFKGTSAGGDAEDALSGSAATSAAGTASPGISVAL